LESLGFTKNEANINLYYIFVGSDLLVLVLYVDDLFLIGADKFILGCKTNMATEFEMKDIDMMHYFLGLEVSQRPEEIFLRRGKCAVEILKQFWMEDCKPIATSMIMNLKKVTASDSELVDSTLYKQLIGSLIYLVNTKPNICFAVNTLSQFIVELKQEHWVVAKRVLKYLRAAMEYGLRYLGVGEVKLHGYTDSDWVGSVADRKSTSRCYFNLGSMMISLFNRKQISMALTLVEIKYIASNTTSCESICFRKLLAGLLIKSWIPQLFTMIIKCFMTSPST
jgi:hypothetical protein